MSNSYTQLERVLSSITTSCVTGRKFHGTELLTEEWDQKTGLRERHDDEVGSIEPLVFHEVRDEGNGLDGFPQTHLVGQDPIQVIVVERNQPFQTFDLTDEEETQRCLSSVPP